MADLTIEQVDAALAKARERGDVPERDVALLWMARADLLGVTFHPQHLVLVMGVTEERAKDLCASLSEHGLIDHGDES